MKIGIQWKLMASHLLLILVMGGFLYFYLDRTINRYLLQEISQNLKNEVRLSALMATRQGSELSLHGQELAQAIGSSINARATVIASDGTVVGDSEIATSNIKELDNHGDRPEVREAFAGKQGAATRYSSTLHVAMLYAAAPFSSKSGERGVIRLALPLTSLAHAKSSLHHSLFIAIALSVAAAFLLGYILSRVLSRSLRTMAAIARDMAQGNFERRVRVHGKDELGELAAAMNAMSAQLSAQMNRLSTEKNRLDAILHGMGEGLLVTDTRGIILMVNPAFRTLFGVGEEVLGMTLLEIVRHPALHDTFRHVSETREETIEELSLPQGKSLLTHWVPLLGNEALEGVVAVFHDITDIKRLEKVRKDFVANVSHELRTPVTVIRGYAETVMENDSSSTEEIRKFVGIIYRHSDRLASLVNDLLALSELESGKIELTLSPTPLAGVIGHCVGLLERKAESKGITVNICNLGEIPPVLAERKRLEQVFINLLDNAVKYTPEEGSITVTADTADGMVKVSVRDTGPGIPDKDLPRLFERFYRVDEARSRAEGGTGLGLSIVKHIVQLHGGEISVTSRPGAGTTFSFTLRRGDGGKTLSR
ncbi:two-component system histidine kinase PnpS [Geobacter sp. DSM 9736]|uniref:two-component system histidine kinase PnpS n=1 Tax=Geobacter sp. DSM 9736 TaxID=1277350 RepID=UPI000B50C517|nr:ATP-binding protein [Geobacter sp. DSM 9736]SNB44872.1 PAS/PAC sensor signal transduction histidine kinase [Geobacter sp. DSM 9736]